MILWMVFWGAGIIVALYVFGGAVFGGEPMAALVLVAWLGGAGFGLLAAARRLKALLLREPGPGRRGFRGQRWTDGVPGPRDP